MSRRRLPVVWLGAFSVLFSFFLLIPVLPLFARDLALSEAQIGVALAAFAVSSMFLRPWAGWAADRFGRRPLMLLGGAVFVLAPLGYGMSVGLASLTAVRLLHGVGMGLYPTAATAMASDLAPPARRAEIMGVFGMAGGLALALGPMTGVTLERGVGLHALFAISAAVAAVGLGLSASVTETLSARTTAPFRIATTMSRTAVFPSLLELCLMLTYGALITFLPLHADRHGLNPGLFFLIYALALTAVRQPAGRISDRRGRAPVAAIALLTSAAALAIVALSDSVVGLMAGGLVYGVGQGMAQPVLIAWCVDRVGPSERGRAMGTFYTALELGIAIGAMTAGLAVSRAGFTTTFLIAAGIALTAALVAISGAAPSRGRGR